jgi:glycosyltransferase involved in cell wall biosynthesis
LHVLFLVRQLGTGGAERQLIALAGGLVAAGHQVTIVTMYAGGALETSAQSLVGARYRSLARRGRFDVRSLVTLRSIVRSSRPDLVHAYMSGANELAQIVSTVSRTPCVWGIRVSDQDFREYSVFRRLVFHSGVWLNRLAALNIANSHAGRAWHVKRGYRANCFVVVPNGIPADRFRFDPVARARWRHQYNVPADSLLCLLPARLDPMKNHALFIRAVGEIAASWGEVKAASPVFAAVGDGETASLRALAAEIAPLAQIRWLPATSDVVAMYSAADVVVSASRFGEGFPNVIGEAMACGRVVVATECGDSSLVIGDCGFVAAQGDAAAFTNQLALALSLTFDKRAELGARARERIEREFSVADMVAKTLDVLERIPRESNRHRSEEPASVGSSSSSFGAQS